MCLFRPNEDFYRQFGSVMVRRYGNVSGSLPETAAEAYAAGIKPTFQQFITYLLDPETERENIFNEHWRQVLVFLSYMHKSNVRLHLLQCDNIFSISLDHTYLILAVGHVPLPHLFLKDLTSIIWTSFQDLRFI